MVKRQRAWSRLAGPLELRIPERLRIAPSAVRRSALTMAAFAAGGPVDARAIAAEARDADRAGDRDGDCDGGDGGDPQAPLPPAAARNRRALGGQQAAELRVEAGLMLRHVQLAQAPRRARRRAWA